MFIISPYHTRCYIVANINANINAKILQITCVSRADMKKLIALITLAVCSALSSFGYTVSNDITSPSFNTPFTTITMNYPVAVAYSITISCPLTISGGSTGTVYLEVSADGSTDWYEIARVSNGQSGTLVIGVAITDTKTLVLSGVVPDNYYVRLRTATTGSPTITLVKGQEMSQG